MKKLAIRYALPALSIPLWVFLAWKAKAVTTGSVELTRWDSIVISNKTFLFFFVLTAIGGFGGYLSTKVPKKRKVYVLAATYALVFTTGYIMAQAQPFRF